MDKVNSEVLETLQAVNHVITIRNNQQIKLVILAINKECGILESHYQIMKEEISKPLGIKMDAVIALFGIDLQNSKIVVQEMDADG